MPHERPAATLRRLIDGYKVSQAIAVVAGLGIADLLAAGPRDSTTLAAEAGCDASALHRVLRALAAAGVLAEDAGGAFVLTPVGAALRSDAPEPLSGWAVFSGSAQNWTPWGDLGHSVRTGGSAFEHAFGVSVWEHREAHPEFGAEFDRAMADMSRRSNRSLIKAYDFGRAGTVVDVGGGSGAFLASLLATYPHMRAILFDLPPVISRARVPEDLWPRLKTVGGSFFDSVPDGADLYLLRSVLHDWSDADAVEILRVCRAAMNARSKLLVIERDLGRPGEALETKLTDLTMLVGPGGRERTVAEYGALLSQAGLSPGASVPAGSAALQVIEATPA